MQLLNQTKKAYLLLADGSVWEGLSMGVEGCTIGEVVFATGMTGYAEALTDPSYYGQILTQTYPLIGNYGVNAQDVESAQTYVRGYIVREWCDTPSNFRSENTIDWFLKKQNIVGLWNIDTRALTKRLREHGVMNGMLTTEDVYDNLDERLARIRSYKITDAVKTVTIDEVKWYKAENSKFKVALFDFGYKRNIRRSLLERGCDVAVVPAMTTPEQLKTLGVDGVMLSNGPGDPAEDKFLIANLKNVLDMGLPVFGICLGHQLVALAKGGKTEKLKYGHRGANQPVLDLEKDRTYVTSQNHGYAVLTDSISKEVGTVTHINANDRSCEGVSYSDGRVFTVQFHPEACGGPTDTSFLFDHFVKLMEAQKEVR